MIGMDVDRTAIRLFKLSRFLGAIETSKKKNEFEIPSDFTVSDHLPKSDVEIIHSSKIEIRREAGALLRQRGKLLSQGSEYDTYEINYENERIFLRELIWHGANVRILEPVNLKEELLSIVDGVLA